MTAMTETVVGPRKSQLIDLRELVRDEVTTDLSRHFLDKFQKQFSDVMSITPDPRLAVVILLTCAARCVHGAAFYCSGMDKSGTQEDFVDAACNTIFEMLRVGEELAQGDENAAAPAG